MKRLDEMEFTEISNIYKNFTKDILTISLFDKISKDYEEKYLKFMKFIDDGYKLKGGTLGRGELKYSRNIIYGWFLEKIILEIISQNSMIRNIDFSGDDGNHNFFINKDGKIEIMGVKSTIPDFLIEFHDVKKLLIELKSAARELFTIKKGNVKSLSKSAAFEKIPTSIIMIDLVNGTFEIKNLKYFINLQPFVNHAMEGQLCYDFPRPTKNIKDLISEDFYQYVDDDIFDFEIVKKYLVLAKSSLNKPKKGKAQELKKYTTIINKKIRVEELDEELILSQEDYINKISKIKTQYPDVEKSWNELDKKLDSLLEFQR